MSKLTRALSPWSTDAEIRDYLRSLEAPDVERVEGLRGGADLVDPRPLGPIRVLTVLPPIPEVTGWDPSWDVSINGYPTADELEAAALALEALAEEL